jgi:L-ascorbate metabolism protein UlaG (beta-lactamase superfamily)
MILTRRHFLAGTAAAGAVTILPYQINAAGHGGHMFETAQGTLTVHPVSHASFVMTTPVGVIHVDPVGDSSAYSGLPAPDLVLVTHEHGDHFNTGTLGALIPADSTAPLVVNPAVQAKLPDALAARATALANGDRMDHMGVRIDAIPAYNTTEGRTNFHPKGRDNGYVLTIGDFRVYVSGDTEDIPEMRALKDIDLAFLCMNLPFTMDATQAASAVAEFRPAYVYPYHYRGRDNGTQDPAEFAALVGDAATVKVHDWYGKSGS